MYRQKIILDVDTATGMPVRDIDDGLAIALALVSPEIELLGCTTCGGNCRTTESTKNTLLWMEMAGRQNVPVAEGRSSPLLRTQTANFQFWEERQEQLGFLWNKMPPLPEPTISKSPLKAHEFIIEMVKKYPGEVVIVKEGALTNLALALLVEPEISPLIKGVVHMGGSFSGGWGTKQPTWYAPSAQMWRYFLRMNTEFDPEATEIVVRSGIPFTFVTTDVTTRVFLRPEHVDRIGSIGTTYHKFIANTSKPWVDFDVNYRNKPGSYLHDPLALAVVIDPTFCRFVDMHCDFERFRNWDYPFLYVGPDSPQVCVSVDVDSERFESFLVDRLASRL